MKNRYLGLGYKIEFSDHIWNSLLTMAKENGLKESELENNELILKREQSIIVTNDNSDPDRSQFISEKDALLLANVLEKAQNRINDCDIYCDKELEEGDGRKSFRAALYFDGEMKFFFDPIQWKEHYKFFAQNIKFLEECIKFFNNGGFYLHGWKKGEEKKNSLEDDLFENFGNLVL